MTKLAVVLVRGFVKTPQDVLDTLHLLNLHRKNYAVVIDDTPAQRGMVRKVKDYITWGEISDEMFRELVSRRGEEYKGRLSDAKKRYNYRTLPYDGKQYKKYFRLNPPRKGFGRKGIKFPFTVSGALGYRGKKINDLLKQMI